MTYYNTNNESAENKKVSEKKTMKQDDIILLLFKETKTFTPSKIWEQFPTKAPLTSVRRSINTLKSNGKIIETGNKPMGIYGKVEREYKLNVKEIA